MFFISGFGKSISYYTDGIEEDKENSSRANPFEEEYEDRENRHSIFAVVGQFAFENLPVHKPTDKERTDQTTYRKTDVRGYVVEEVEESHSEYFGFRQRTET